MEQKAYGSYREGPWKCEVQMGPGGHGGKPYAADNQTLRRMTPILFNAVTGELSYTTFAFGVHSLLRCIVECSGILAQSERYKETLQRYTRNDGGL